jgi:hypothetical protein
MTDSKLVVKYEIFRGSFESWDSLFSDAAEFASQISRDRLIGISHSEDKNNGVVTVWYWNEPE